MNPCNEWHKRIVKCIDSEANENERAQVIEHIHVCSGCQAYHERYFKIKQAYKAVAEPVSLCGIRQELLDEIEKDITYSSRAEAELRSKPYTWRLTMGRAAVIFLIVSLSTACTYMARSNSALKRDLQYARLEVTSLQQKEQILSPQNRQMEAIPEAPDRVRDLEGHMRLGMVSSSIWQSEFPYCQPEVPGKL